ncbi:MAG TPA: hypothetical protein VIT22_12950 [Pseudoxanthomonas sp.]
MALAPDGTKYYFDWMVGYLERALHGRRQILLGYEPQRSFWVSADLPRKNYRLYPTRIEDRFGNSVTYTWSGANLTSITSSDGRSITFTYNGSLVTSATDGTRSVWYSYSDGLLSAVTLPDASAWTFSSAAMLSIKRFVPLGDPDPYDFPMPCQLMRRLTGDEADFVMTHPSGAVGNFRMTFKRHFRTNLLGSTGSCPFTWAEDGPRTFRDHMPDIPNRYDVLALKRKSLAGPGIATQTWEFAHQDAYSMSPDYGYPIAGTRTVTTTQPDSSTSVSLFGTDALANEAQLLNNEVREGATVLSRTENGYVQTSEMSGMPFPDWMGQPLEYEFIRGRSDYNRPLRISVTKQQGVAFTKAIDLFDVFARPKQVTKSSAPAP